MGTLDVRESSELEEFVRKLKTACSGSRENWINMINFGRATLLREPQLLLRLIVDEAFYKVDSDDRDNPTAIADEVSDLLQALNLRIGEASNDAAKA